MGKTALLEKTLRIIGKTDSPELTAAVDVKQPMGVYLNLDEADLNDPKL